MKLAIIGSRSFNDFCLLDDTIKKYFCDTIEGLAVDEVVSGGATGADSVGAEWSKEYKIKLKEFPAQWYNLDLKPCKIKLDKNGRQYNVLSGFNRNSDIINHADTILCFWDGQSTGTKDSIDKAIKLKKPVIIIPF